MPLNIRDEDVNQLAERLAALRGVTKTDAVREALRRDLRRVETHLPLADRVRPIQARIARNAETAAHVKPARRPKGGTD